MNKLFEASFHSLSCTGMILYGNWFGAQLKMRTFIKLFPIGTRETSPHC